MGVYVGPPYLWKPELDTWILHSASIAQYDCNLRHGELLDPCVCGSLVARKLEGHWGDVVLHSSQ